MRTSFLFQVSDLILYFHQQYTNETFKEFLSTHFERFPLVYLKFLQW